MNAVHITKRDRRRRELLGQCDLILFVDDVKTFFVKSLNPRIPNLYGRDKSLT